MSEECNGCEEKIKLLVGPRGKRGEKGDRGEIGPVGPVGPVGPQGFTGPQGTSGNQGIPGDKGNDGSNGNQGPAGVQGAQGDPGADAIQPVIEMTDTCTVEFTEVTGFPNYNFSAEIVDTGWKDLEGFSHYHASMQKPKVKRVGKVLYFKGLVLIPLSNNSGSALIPCNANGFASYDAQAFNQVYTGTGGVIVNTDGAITFNNNGSGVGLSILPASLGLCNKTLDDNYNLQYVAQRQIVTSSGTDGASLSSSFSIILLNNGQLLVQTLKDIEDSNTGTGGNVGGSPLRYITSKVKSGDFVPNFSLAGSRLHTFKPNVILIVDEGSGYTNGTYLNVNITGVSGTNMLGTIVVSGGVISSAVVTSVGTGYSAGDILTFGLINDAGITVGTGFRGSLVGNVLTDVSNRTYLFDCDAAEPAQIGGFIFRLDGLMAHLA